MAHTLTWVSDARGLVYEKRDSARLQVAWRPQGVNSHGQLKAAECSGVSSNCNWSLEALRALTEKNHLKAKYKMKRETQVLVLR